VVPLLIMKRKSIFPWQPTGTDDPKSGNCSVVPPVEVEDAAEVLELDEASPVSVELPVLLDELDSPELAALEVAPPPPKDPSWVAGPTQLAVSRKGRARRTGGV
jgi:hypothetical protein